MEMTKLDQEIAKEQFFQTDATWQKFEDRKKKKDVVLKTCGAPWFAAQCQILSLTAGFDVLGQTATCLFVGESGFLFRQLSLKTAKVIKTFRGHKGPVTSVAYLKVSDTVSFLVSSSWDKMAKLWDESTGQVVRTLEGHADFVKCVQLRAFSNEEMDKIYTAGCLKRAACEDKFGVLCFSGSSDRTIRVWNASTGESLLKLEGHSRAIECLAVHPSLPQLFSSSSDSTIKRWDLLTGNCIGTLTGHLTSVYEIRISETCEELWSASADGNVIQWDIEKGKSLKTFNHLEWVKCFALSDKYLITGNRDELIRVWDIYDMKVVHVFDAHLDEVSQLVVIGNDLYSAAYDGNIRKWNLEDVLKKPVEVETTEPVVKSGSGATEDEDKELDDLMKELEE